MSVGIIHDQVVPVVSFVADPLGAVLPLVMLTINVKVDFSVIVLPLVQPETLVLIANMILSVP